MTENKFSKTASTIKNAVVSEAKQATKSINKIVNPKSEDTEMSTYIEDNAYELGKNTRNVLDGAMKVGYSGTDYIEKQTKERPLAALGFSMVLGMLIGKLMSARRGN